MGPQDKKHSKISVFKSREEMRAGDRLRNYVLETIAILFWMYSIAKVFIFDIDAWAFGKFLPHYLWVLNFKLIFVLVLTSLTWLWVGTRDMIVWFFYITFYPLVLLVIRLPIFIFKQESWVLAFAVFNAIASFFRSLKYSVIFTTLFLCAFAIALFGEAHYMLIAAGTLVALVFIAYVRSFITALKPTVIFQIYSKFFKGVRKAADASFALDIEIKNLPVEQMEPKQIEKWNTSLQTSVLFNRFCIFAARRLRDYQKSEWRIIGSLFGFLWLVAFTVVAFSGVYYALFKWEPALFSFTQTPTFFTFLYYSFNNLIFNSTAELSPVMMLSQSVYMVQATLSFVLIVMLATLYISHRAQRSSSELDEVIADVQAEADSMENFIQTEYKISNIAAAMEHLKQAQSSLVRFIYWLSKGTE